MGCGRKTYQGLPDRSPQLTCGPRERYGGQALGCFGYAPRTCGETLTIAVVLIVSFTPCVECRLALPWVCNVTRVLCFFATHLLLVRPRPVCQRSIRFVRPRSKCLPVGGADCPRRMGEELSGLEGDPCRGTQLGGIQTTVAVEVEGREHRFNISITRTCHLTILESK